MAELSQHPFFDAPPPKSAGREQFGLPYVDDLIARAAPASEQDWCDLLATAAELTAFGIFDSYRRHVAPVVAIDAVMVSGGGARNPEVMARLTRRFAPIPVRSSDHYGLPVDAKEAIASLTDWHIASMNLGWLNPMRTFSICGASSPTSSHAAMIFSRY